MKDRPDIPNVVSMDELRQHRNTKRNKSNDPNATVFSNLPWGVKVFATLAALIIPMHMAFIPPKSGLMTLFVWGVLYWMVFINPNSMFQQKFKQYKVIFIIFGILLALVFTKAMIEIAVLSAVYWYFVQNYTQVPSCNRFLKTSMLTLLSLTLITWFIFIFLFSGLDILSPAIGNTAGFELPYYTGANLHSMRTIVYFTISLILGMTALFGKSLHIPWLSNKINP